MSAVPTLRFPEFDGVYEKKLLGEISKIATGRLDANAMRDDGEYTFFTCAKETYKIDQYAFDTEALLVSGNGANVGYIHYYHGKFNAYQRTYVLDEFKENIKYVEYVLQKNLKSRIFSEVKEGNTPYIVKATLSEMDILHPSLPEQQKIAAFLSSVDRKIDLLLQKKDALEFYKKGLMQKIFSQEIRFKQDDGSDFPDWEEVALGEHTSVIMGQSPSSEGYNDEGLGLPLIQGNADIKNRFTSPQRYTSVCSKTAEAGDIIMCVRAPIGLVSVCTEVSCLGRGVAALRAKSSLRQNFLFQFLIMFEDRWVRIGQGSTFTAINGADIKGLEFPLPCPDEQQKIASLLSLLDVKIGTASSQIEQMETFKKGLLQQMFV